MPDLKVIVVVHDRHEGHQGVDGWVEFQATDDCTLYFSNPEIFGTPHIDLQQGQPVRQQVKKEGYTTWNALAPPERLVKRPGKMSNPNEIVIP